MDAVYGFTGAGRFFALYFLIKGTLRAVDAVYGFTGAGRCFIQGAIRAMNAVRRAAGTLRFFALIYIQRTIFCMNTVHRCAGTQRFHTFICDRGSYRHQAQKQNDRKETG